MIERPRNAAFTNIDLLLVDGSLIDTDRKLLSFDPAPCAVSTPRWDSRTLS
jgi:hypothetical protein